jgi:lysophospholipase L1-like esterase
MSLRPLDAVHLARRRSVILGVAMLAVVAIPVGAAAGASEQGASAGQAHAQPEGNARWEGTWAASPQQSTPGTLSATGFDDQTVRNIVFATTGGDTVRVRLTNTFGTQPLVVDSASIAVAGSGAGLAAGARPLRFGDHASTIIPPGAEALSDPLHLTVRPLQDLAVSLYLPQATGPATQHALGQQVNYVATGNHALDASAAAFTTQTQSWYFLDGIDVLATARDRGTIVAYGDSITDGFHSTVNANARWPNDLARRLDALHGTTMSVVDQGISGNRVLNDSICCGVNALARFNRDVVDQTGATEVILLEGINDIGFSQLNNPVNAPATDVTAAQIIAGYQQLIAQAHAAGLKIFGGTLTPFQGSGYYYAAGEAKRQAVNHWIRTSHAFDAVIDFDKVVRDPAHPLTFLPAYDSGDHLHPNDAGYQAMAQAINLHTLLQ